MQLKNIWQKPWELYKKKKKTRKLVFDIHIVWIVIVIMMINANNICNSGIDYSYGFYLGRI